MENLYIRTVWSEVSAGKLYFSEEPPYKVDFSNTVGAKVSCDAEGDTNKPTIRWILSDGSAIDSIPGLREVHSNGDLIFKPFRPENYRLDVHSAVYRCVATNSAGQLISREVYDTYVSEKNTAVLRCHIPKIFNGFVKVVGWLKNDNLFIAYDLKNVVNDKYAVMPNGDLHIYDVTSAESSANYKCKTVNSLTGESQWYRKHSSNELLPLRSNTQLTITKSGLIIRNIQISDEGAYVCKVVDVPSDLQISLTLVIYAPLSVKVHPDGIDAKTGEHVIMTCETDGQPVNQISWFHNGRQTKNGMENKLIINSVGESSGGIYQCMVKNDEQMFQASTELHLSEVIPYFTTIFEEITLQPGFSASIACTATGIPTPSVQWKFNGKKIKDGHRIQIDNTHENKGVFSQLKIDRLTVEDSGLYSCEAINSGGSSEHISRINVHGNVGMHQQQTLIAVSDGLLVLNCPYYGYPVHYIQWKKNDRMLPDNLRQTLYANGTLVTTDIDRISDSGEYKCSVKDNRGKIFEGTINAKILVPPKIVPFEFQDELLREGMRARLQCVISEGDLPLKVEWLKDGNKISNELGILIKTLDEFSSILTIHSIIPKHNGKYTCVASNDAATVTHSAQLSVNGMRSLVTCAISQGDQPLTFEWLKDGKAIPMNIGIVTRKYDQNTDSLSIENVDSRHSGNYTCIVRNQAGKAMHTAQLMVRVRPKIVPFQFGDLHYEGSSARVVCGLQEGDAPIQFSWLHDDQPIANGGSITVFNTDGLSSILSISSLRASSHAGTFTCIARNGAGVDRHKAVLRVNGDHVFEGALARLTCVVYQGDLPLTLNWLIDNQPITTSFDVNVRSVDTYTSILTIDSVQRKHQGNYSCVASNKAASASHTASLVVNVPPKIVPFEFKEEQLVEGLMARVSCIVSRGDLPLDFYWEKSGVVIEPGSLKMQIRSFDEHSSILSIPSVSVQHNGVYTCVVKNDVGMARHSARLVVKVPPRWIQLPSDVTVIRDAEVLLNCLVDGFPKPEITWKHIIDVNFPSRSSVLETNSNIQLNLNGSLLIKKVTEETEGFYFCHATNGIGKGLSAKLIVKINVPPSFKNTISSRSAAIGSDAELRCSVEGDSPLKITWFKNDRLIQIKETSHKINTTNTTVDVTSILTIYKVDRSSNGNYSCRAENKYGSNQTAIELLILESPDAPTQLKVESVESTAVEISWSPSYSGNEPIKKYLIQYKEAAVMLETVNGVPTNSIVNQLYPSTTYIFRVFAENIRGRSLASQNLRVTTEEDIPSAAPINVQIESINTQTFKVTWKAPKEQTWNGKILGYNIGYKEVDSEKPFLFKTLVTTDPNSNELFVHIGDLKQFTKYIIIVQAYNSKGRGPQTEDIIAMTSEGAPIVSPTDIRCTTLTSQSIHVTWSGVPAESMNGILSGYKVLYKPAMDWLDDFADHFNITLETSITLNELDKFANYSVQIQALTKAGHGPKSEPVFCKTLDDVPAAPADIKAAATSNSTVIVAWKVPDSPNGVIKSYTLYWKEHDKEASAEQHTVFPHVNDYLISGLTKGILYEFWVTASTIAGEGKASKIVTHVPVGPAVPANIVSFDSKITTPWKSNINLPCIAVGTPEPTRTWSSKGRNVDAMEGAKIRTDGSLSLHDIKEDDAGDYTCTARNDLGEDKITHTVIVLSPPNSPEFDVTSVTSDAMELRWKTTSSKIFRVKGYTLHIKKDGGGWKDIPVTSDARSYRVNSLDCGTRYEIYMSAFNKIGISASSPIYKFSTNGSVPTSPMKLDMLEEDSTSVSLYLNTWKSNGCPIQYFMVEYAAKSSNQWTTVSTHIKPDQKRLVIPGLRPGTWYKMRMTAHNSAGSTIATYEFATLTTYGGTVAPDVQMDSSNEQIDGLMAALSYYVVVPVVCTFVILIAIFGLACVCIRMKKREIQARNNAVNRMSAMTEYYQGDNYDVMPYFQMATLHRKAAGSQQYSDEIAPYATLPIHRQHATPTHMFEGGMINQQFTIPHGLMANTGQSTETTFVFPSPPSDIAFQQGFPPPPPISSNQEYVNDEIKPPE
ncbi:Down syndrome cell adhesion molecule-like protein 1 [Chamberlinius hualienensis]